MLNVIFDMDGTLLDSEPSICGAVNEIRESLGFSKLSDENILHTIHTPSLNCAEVFYNIKDFPHKSYKVGFEKYFSKHYENATLFDGVDEMLKTCKERKYFLAIASNAPHSGLKPILQKHKIAEFFDVIIGTDSHIESKPNPMMIYRILQNAPFKSSVFVGNCIKDEGAATNANIPYLQAKWGEETHAKNEFSDAKELLAKLEKI
ncbi:HAD family hydrolase [Helicobacter aurati]|uniref:phosphoglycolate phosphatase n=1 Tax=Helicobacter aurati TaxID=137778 RepID=A0A3D8J880_9HELI|nr:HAD family hydrolase [Helicobacter aurati]RDU73084.1 HAD family hydrolase [Helicobacter aurati]